MQILTLIMNLRFILTLKIIIMSKSRKTNLIWKKERIPSRREFRHGRFFRVFSLCKSLVRKPTRHSESSLKTR
jgi:hypothetical protein